MAESRRRTARTESYLLVEDINSIHTRVIQIISGRITSKNVFTTEKSVGEGHCN